MTAKCDLYKPFPSVFLLISMVNLQNNFLFILRTRSENHYTVKWDTITCFILLFIKRDIIGIPLAFEKELNQLGKNNKKQYNDLYQPLCFSFDNNQIAP